MVSAKWQMILVFMASSALAVNPAPLYPAALKQSAPYQMASTEVQEASKALGRTQSDPIALKPEVLQAQQRLELARATLISQALQVRQQLLLDLQNLDQLQVQQDAQETGLLMAQLSAQATRAKFKAGASTQLEVSREENELHNAEKDLQATKKQFQDASERFKKRYGKVPDLSGEDQIKWNSEQLHKALQGHPSLLRAQATEENASLQYAIKSSDLSPTVEVESARVALQNAKDTVQDTLRDLQEALEDALKQHQVAMNGVAARQKALELARANLATQKTRFDRGLVSRLQYLQAELDVKNAIVALHQAQANASKAAQAVLLAANHNPWGEGQ